MFLFSYNACIWAVSQENLSLGFSDQFQQKPDHTPTEDGHVLEVSDLEIRGIVLSMSYVAKSIMLISS